MFFLIQVTRFASAHHSAISWTAAAYTNHPPLWLFGGRKTVCVFFFVSGGIGHWLNLGQIPKSFRDCFLVVRLAVAFYKTNISWERVSKLAATLGAKKLSKSCGSFFWSKNQPRHNWPANLPNQGKCFPQPSSSSKCMDLVSPREASFRRLITFHGFPSSNKILHPKGLCFFQTSDLFWLLFLWAMLVNRSDEMTCSEQS